MKRRFRKYEQICEDIPTMLSGMDLPHTWRGGKWLKNGPAPLREPEASFRSLCHYANKLRELGMSDVDICFMFADLYWDAFTEFQLNNTYAQYEPIRARCSPPAPPEAPAEGKPKTPETPTADGKATGPITEPGSTHSKHSNHSKALNG